jgi:hypothetical protein
MNSLEKELQSFKIKELKDFLLQYSIRTSDIEGTGKNNCVTKKDIIKTLVEAIQEEDLYDGVDIFDFKTYKHEYEFMKLYFTDLELYLRTALFIDYKYNYLPPEQNMVFEDKIKTKKQKKHQMEYITSVLDSFEPLYIVTKWFLHFAPEKLKNNSNFALNAVNKYKNYNYVMFNRMYKARIDPNWDDMHKLWFA